MIPRAECERVFREAVLACDPAKLVAAAMPKTERAVLAIAIGKAALAMARGAGPVARGIAIAPTLDGEPLPLGWSARDSTHPEPDERSLAAADAVIGVVRAAGPDDLLVALISGGASSLVEKPIEGVPLDELRARVREKMASGASIHELNALRKQLSATKGGKLAMMCAAPIVTLVASDVVDDDPAIVGSGPTIADRPGDRVEVIAPMDMFHGAVVDALASRGVATTWIAVNTGEVAGVAVELARIGGTVVMWGEPTLRVPADHGEGGRAQQLALELARHLRGGPRSAFVAGSDGIDGPAPHARPAPAGAYVDGTTWDAMVRAGIDPERALVRCDAGTALHAVGALFVPGPTGINHGDVAIVG